MPIKALHKMSEAQIKREAAVHPLVWERTVGACPGSISWFSQARESRRVDDFPETLTPGNDG